MKNWNLATLEKKLKEARSMYEIAGLDCKLAAESGSQIQLKNAQRRSLSLSNSIYKLEMEIKRRGN
jgi:hypothetical protein